MVIWGDVHRMMIMSYLDRDKLVVLRELFEYVKVMYADVRA